MHILQPKHTKLKSNEILELLKKYNISPSQLPKIKATDPALGGIVQVGDIVKIERKDDSGKNVIYFRVVV